MLIYLGSTLEISIASFALSALIYSNSTLSRDVTLMRNCRGEKKKRLINDRNSFSIKVHKNVVTVTLRILLRSLSSVRF